MNIHPWDHANVADDLRDGQAGDGILTDWCRFWLAGGDIVNYRPMIIDR